jgi:hypothetical protein
MGNPSAGMYVNAFLPKGKISGVDVFTEQT